MADFANAICISYPDSSFVSNNRKFYAATISEDADLLQHLTYMTSLAEQLCEMKEDISLQKFATVVLGSLRESYDNFLTGLNARDVEDLDWENIKGLLTEEYMKRKEKNEKQKSDDALFTRKGPSARGRSHTRGGHFGNSHTGSRDCKSSSYNRGHQEQPNKGQREVRGPKCFQYYCIGHVVKNCPLNKCNSVNIAENSERSESQGFENEDVALSLSTNDRTGEWFIDSAATKHMTYSRSILMDFIQYNDPLKIY